MLSFPASRNDTQRISRTPLILHYHGFACDVWNTWPSYWTRLRPAELAGDMSSSSLPWFAVYPTWQVHQEHIPLDGRWQGGDKYTLEEWMNEKVYLYACILPLLMISMTFNYILFFKIQLKVSFPEKKNVLNYLFYTHTHTHTLAYSHTLGYLCWKLLCTALLFTCFPTVK